jgi:hypothetical protein
MKIIEKQGLFATYKAYEDVDLKFKNFAKFVRVLPAQYFNEPHRLFTLAEHFLPGENKNFPNGGFSVYNEAGGMSFYDLDQVIIHPYVLGIRKFGDEKEPKLNDKPVKVKSTTGGKKGRKPLSDDEKTKRELEVQARKERSGGQRGRPKK